MNNITYNIDFGTKEKSITLVDSDGDGIISVLFDDNGIGIDISLSDINGNMVTTVFNKDEFKKFISLILHDMD